MNNKCLKIDQINIIMVAICVELYVYKIICVVFNVIKPEMANNLLTCRKFKMRALQLHRGGRQKRHPYLWKTENRTSNKQAESVAFSINVRYVNAIFVLWKSVVSSLIKLRNIDILKNLRIQQITNSFNQCWYCLGGF